METRWSWVKPLHSTVASSEWSWVQPLLSTMASSELSDMHEEYNREVRKLGFEPK